LVAFGVVGLVLGWALRPVALRLGYVEPAVPLASAALLAFVAAVIGYAAWSTRRLVRRHRQDLPHHQAVNRLVLGKACALAGALVGGGYWGYALAQVGVGDPLAGTRLWHSALAGVTGIAVMVASLLLEHACRVPPVTD
jgi:hypothetical protein